MVFVVVAVCVCARSTFAATDVSESHTHARTHENTRASLKHRGRPSAKRFCFRNRKFYAELQTCCKPNQTRTESEATASAVWRRGSFKCERLKAPARPLSDAVRCSRPLSSSLRPATQVPLFRCARVRANANERERMCLFVSSPKTSAAAAGRRIGSGLRTTV